MYKFMKRTFSFFLVFCLLLGNFVPDLASAATSDTVVYDFYTPYKSYSYLYHWRVVDDDDIFDASNELPKDTKVASDKIIADYNSGISNWKWEHFSGYTTVSAKGYVALNLSNNSNHIFRIKSPGSGNYEVDINYVITNLEKANPAAELMIIPAEKESYTSQELESLVLQYRFQQRISCYDAKTYSKAQTATLSYSFLEGEEYFFVVSGGSTGGAVYMQNLTARRVGEYNPPKTPEFPRPVTVVEDAMPKWRDDCSCVANVNNCDYLALPINGGKMYIYNLDTWQLVDEVNIGISVPRGITADDNGVIYVVGDSYYIYKYDLKTNKSGFSSRFTVDGASAGSAYDLHVGDDGNLYFGTDKGHIIRYNPSTDKATPIFSTDYGIANATYVSSVIQKGQYIYAAVTTNTSRHYLVKLDKDTFEVSGICEYTSAGSSSYLSHMSIIPGGSPTGGDIIMGGTSSLMAIDTDTMKLMTPEEFGVSESVTGYVSEEIDGKYYYVSSAKRDVYVFDKQTKKASKSEHIGVVNQGFASHGKSFTLTRNGVTDQYLYGFTDAKGAIYFTNLRTGAVQTIKDLIDKDAGASNGVNSLTSGPAGSNELYYGGFLSDQVAIYNTQLGKVTEKVAVAGIQTDAICVYDGQIYSGNYTEAQLTRLHRDTNKPEVLMTLHNSLFNQSRIHSIVAGDNKLFLGTFPYVYGHGGVLAWYDLETNCSYVAVGQNPEDVYIAEYTVNGKNNTKYNYTANKPTVPVNEVVWYRNGDATKTPVTSIEGGVTGVVTNQSIIDVAYYDGILYAATSTTGGTNTKPIEGTSAEIIAYDISAKKVIATCKLADYGFAYPVPAVSGIETDENGNLWCVASETLFTLELNGARNGFNYTEKLSFDKKGYDGTQGRSNSDIRFKDGYIYVAFERLGGLCKVNRADPSDYTMLLPDVTTNSAVPEHFDFGEDGNLYILYGTSLKTLVTDPTEAEWETARAVTEQISAITPDTVVQTRQAYEKLTLRQKSLVQNYDDLLQAEADALAGDIENLGEVSLKDRERVESLLTVYRHMPKSQQNMVTNYYVLVNANQKIQILDRGCRIVATDKAGVLSYYQTLEDALSAIKEGTITLYGDVTAGTVILRPGVTLDLNGYTLTADFLVSMNGATVLDGGAECAGGGLLKIAKGNLALAEDNAGGVIPVWNGVDGYIFTKVTFQQIAKPVGSGAAQYIFLPSMSNPEAAALLADGGLDNELKIKVSLIWNNGQSQQFYTYGDELVKKVFDGTGRWVFELKITGIAGIEDMVANPVLVTDCGTQATTESVKIEDYQPLRILEYAFGYMEIVGS